MRLPVTMPGALRLDAACALGGGLLHLGWSALGVVGLAPSTWRILAAVSVAYAALAWSLARAARPSLTPMIWLNRAWGGACMTLAAVAATGLPRLWLVGEAAAVVGLSWWEARVAGQASAVVAQRPR